MIATKPNKLAAVPLPVILQRCAFPPETLESIAGLATVEAVVGKLAAAGQGMEAARVLAHALPKREAVWWACLCARDRLPPEPSPVILAALKAAEDWVYKPTEENRRAAMAKAEAAQFDTPSSWAAVGAFWSGGSMSPEGNPVVPPGEHLTGLAVAGSIMLAAAQTEPQHATERYQQFLAYGANIARGGRGRDPGAAA